MIAVPKPTLPILWSRTFNGMLKLRPKANQYNCWRMLLYQLDCQSNPKVIQMFDRFELRQSAVRRSTVFPAVSGRSFISTALVNESMAYGDDLRKSRIQNLPNYKKNNLGENISFIVVFQTIEIERLSNEIQLLRVKLKQAERQLFNAANYEVQIRELTEKCFNYETQLEDFREEYEKLNKICENLYHENETLKNQLNEIDFSLKQKYDSERSKNQELLGEIEKWRTRYQASEKSKAKQLEELRNLMDSQRKSMIDREIREATIRFQNERSSLENEIRKCRQILSNRDSEIDNYKQKCQKYEISIMELRNYENVINEHENKLAVLSNELIRLTDLLRNRDDDIQNYKKREYDFTLKLKEQADLNTDNLSLRGLLEAKAREIDEWRGRCGKLEEEAMRGKEMVHYNHELTDKLDLASRELQRLNALLKTKLDEIERWKQRVAGKEAELTQYKNLENDLAHYDSKLSMLRAENQRINGILKSRLEEIQTWKRKNAELEAALTKMAFLQKDKKMFEDKFNNQIKTHEELKFALNRSETENQNLRKWENRCRELQSKGEGLAKQIQRLNAIVRNKEQELNDSRIKSSSLENSISEYKNIQIYLKDNQNKIALLTQQIDRLNNLMAHKNQDIQGLQREKIELHSLVNKYKNYELKIHENEQLYNQLNQHLDNLKREHENGQNKCRAAELKAKELESQLYAHSQEKEKVGNIARAKTQECDQLKNRYNNAQAQLKRIPELQNLCEHLHKQSLLHLSDYETIERKYRQIEGLLAREKSGSLQLKSKLTSTANELERLTAQLRQSDSKKDKEFSDLQDHYSKLQTRVKAKDNENELLIAKISQLQSQCAQLMKEFNRLLQAFEQSYKESAGLNQKIEEYQDYARRIHILGAELDRLSQINKGLEDDNKAMRLKYANNINFEKKEEEMTLAKVLMAVEIQSLRTRMDQRELSLEEMRKSILDPIRRV